MYTHSRARGYTLACYSPLTQLGECYDSTHLGRAATNCTVFNTGLLHGVGRYPESSLCCGDQHRVAVIRSVGWTLFLLWMRIRPPAFHRDARMSSRRSHLSSAHLSLSRACKDCNILKPFFVETVFKN